MQNLSLDYLEITADPLKSNFIKDYLSKTHQSAQIDVKDKIKLKPKDLMYETLPPIDKDPHLTRHRSNIIKSRMSFDKKIPEHLASRDVSNYMDSKPIPIQNPQHKLKEELLSSLGIKEPLHIFNMPTEINELKRQIQSADLLLWGLHSIKNLNFSDHIEESIRSGLLKEPETLNITEYGAPSNRKEAELLSNWLNFMLRRTLEKNLSKEELFENAQIIYTSCLRELTRQISVHCMQRGELLERVWSTYFKIMIKTINVYQKSKINQQKRFESDLSSIKSNYLQQISDLKSEVAIKDKNIEDLNITISSQSIKLTRVSIKNEELRTRINILQSQYSKDKFRLLRVEDDYKNLKEVQKIVLEEMDENIPGIKKVQMKSKIRFRELSKFFLADPLCGNLTKVTLPESIDEDPKTYVELEKIDLENKVKLHEIQTKIDETAEELIDVTVDTSDLAVLIDKECETALEEFVVEVVDNYVEEHVPKDLRNIELVLKEKILNETLDNEELEVYFGKEPLGNGLEHKELNNVIDGGKHEEILNGIKGERQKSVVKGIVRKITNELQEASQRVINKLKIEYNELIERNMYEKIEIVRLRKQIFLTYKENLKIKEENEKIKEKLTKNAVQKTKNVFKKNLRTTKKRKTRYSVMKPTSKLVVFKNEAISPAETLFQRTLAHKETRKSNVRSITLIKLINAIVTNYTNQMKEEQMAQTQPLYIYVYEHFLAKHGGIKKVLETKYRQFLLSCEFHKQIPLINLFSRFLGLFNPLEIEYFRTFIRINELLARYNRLGVEIIPSEIDDPLIPLIRCNEVTNAYFKDKYTEYEIMNIRSELSKITKPCPKCINQGVIEKTEFMYFVIQHYRNFLKLSTNNVKDLFDAADLNGDNFLQFEEFDMLFRCIESERYSLELSKNCFSSYSDLIAEMNGVSYPAISYDRFTIFALEKDYFKIEAQNTFIEGIDSIEIQKRLQILHNKYREVIDQIKWRMRESGKTSQSFTEMIETLRKKLIENDQRRSVYLGYLLIDKESKYKVADSIVQKIMPDFVKLFDVARNLYFHKKTQNTIIQRQITWKKSIESVSDWEGDSRDESREIN